MSDLQQYPRKINLTEILQITFTVKPQSERITFSKNKNIFDQPKLGLKGTIVKQTSHSINEGYLSIEQNL